LVITDGLDQRKVFSQVWLLLRWVMFVGSTSSWHSTSHPGLLSLAILPWVDAMNISKSWGVNWHATQYTTLVFAAWQCKLLSSSCTLYRPTISAYFWYNTTSNSI